MDNVQNCDVKVFSHMRQREAKKQDHVYLAVKTLQEVSHTKHFLQYCLPVPPLHISYLDKATHRYRALIPLLLRNINDTEI
jgi:hypothetical protein